MSAWSKLRSGEWALDYRKMLETVRREKLEVERQLAFLDEREKQIIEWIEQDEPSDIGSSE